MIIDLNDNQKEILEIIKEQKKQYGIFFDMGVGKTALILSLIEYIVFDKLENLKVLIIAPAMVANVLRVWQEEIQKWENFNYFDFYLLNGTQDVRKKKLATKDCSITIMSDGLIDWWYKEFGHLDMYDMIVIDESSRFKSPKAKRFKYLSKMVDPEIHRIYLLSGTPVPKGWQDIWAQIYLLDKGKRLGKSYWKFLDSYFSTFGYKVYLTKNNRIMILDQIKDICVFADSKKINLPKKTEKKIYLKFPYEKQKTFDYFKKTYLLELEEEEINVMSKQILINKCLQLSNGCVYHGKQGEYSYFDDTKLQFVKKYSEDHPQENILVAYPFKFDKKRLLELPGAKAIQDIDSIKLWNEGKIKLGIISPFSFQYGGNLQFGGHTIIWFGLIWALENYLQLNKRLHRQGQKHEVKVLYVLMENTWDDYVYKCVVSKELSQEEFLQNIHIRRLQND